MKKLFSVTSLLVALLSIVSIYQVLHLEENQQPFKYFVTSFIVSSVGFFIFLKQASFYGTLKHELCHWLASVLTFSKPNALAVSQFGGQYSYQSNVNRGSFKDGVISLAPYFLPITTIAFVIIKLMVDQMTSLYSLFIGLAMAFDYVSMYKDYHKHQTDFSNFGVNFSMFVSACWSVIFFAVLTSIIHNDLAGLKSFWNHVLVNGQSAVLWLKTTLMDLYTNIVNQSPE